MTRSIQREIVVPQPIAQVWQALTTSAALADWMYPNDFQPIVGHRFTFRVPPKPSVGFEGLTVRCQVLECDPPCQNAAGENCGGRLVFSWSVSGPVENTQVSFRLEPDGNGTRLFFEHAGFDVTQPFGEHALAGAEYGWSMMLEQLAVWAESRSSAVYTERLFHFSPRKIFAAFEQPEQLAAWWGPAGFTSTFEQFEFRVNGRWLFVMHAPSGAHYPNDSFFREIQPDQKIVIEHVVAPWFLLTVTLTDRSDETRGEQTLLSWVQQFESPELAAKMRVLSETANAQVLDRLEAVLSQAKN